MAGKKLANVDVEYKQKRQIEYDLLKPHKTTKKKLMFKLLLALEFEFYFIAGLCCRWFASQGV